MLIKSGSKDMSQTSELATPKVYIANISYFNNNLCVSVVLF